MLVVKVNVHFQSISFMLCDGISRLIVYSPQIIEVLISIFVKRKGGL